MNNNQEEVIFTVSGYRPFEKEICKRGVKIKLNNTNKDDPQLFLQEFRAALDALYRHEENILSQSSNNCP